MHVFDIFLFDFFGNLGCCFATMCDHVLHLEGHVELTFGTSENTL